MSKPGSSIRRWALRGLWVLLSLLALDQIALRVFVQSDRLFGRPLLPYFPPEFKATQSAAEARLVFDQELGWRLAAPSEGGTLELDWSGGRLGSSSLMPRKRQGVTRILLLGGSNSLGSHLPVEATFASQLDTNSLQHEIINHSTPLYGLDQALIRLRFEGLPLRPDEIWVALEPDTALVATTRYLPFVRCDTSEALFKPRFRLFDNGELTLLPTPIEEEAAAGALLSDRDRYLTELASTEMWASTQTPLAIPGLGEEFLGSKLAATWRLERQLAKDLRLSDPRSLAFRTLVALAIELDHEATGNGARLRILILPDKASRASGASGTEPPYARFVDEIRSYGMEVIELPLSAEATVDGDRWTAADHQLVSETLQSILASEL